MTALDLCNNALALLGEHPLHGIDPNGTLPQRMCHLHYHPVRREVLRSHPWLFAKRKVTLHSAEPVDEGMHAVPHAIPSDSLLIRSVDAPGWSLRGKCIFCAKADVEATYTRDEEDLDLWSADALYCFTHLLAARMCIPLVNNTALRYKLMDKYNRRLHQIQNPKS